MLPITRATVDKFCCSCLLELPQNNKNRIDDDDIEVHKWFQSTTSSSLFVMEDQCYQSKNYTISLCNSCYTKARLFYGFRDKSICVSIAYNEVIDEKRVNADNIFKLRWFCITCLKNLRSFDGVLGGYDLVEDKRLQDWLMDCCAISIKGVDYTPTRVCNQCFRKLRCFSEFKRVAQESQEYLDNILGNNEEKNISLISNIRELTKECNNSSSLKADDIHEDDQLNAESILILPGDEESVMANNIKHEEESSHDPLNEKAKDLVFLPKMESDSDYDNTIFNAVKNSNNNSNENINNNVTSLNSGRILRTRKLRIFSPKQDENDSNDDDDDWEVSIISTPPLNKRYESLNQTTTTITDSNPSQSNQKNKIIKCEKCGKRFRKRFLYEAHVRGQHEGLEKPFVCEKCPKDFSCYGTMRRHYVEIHNMVFSLKEETTKLDLKLTSRKWQCSDCDLVLITKGELSDHMTKAHNDIRRYKCDYCSRTFKRRNHLCDHIKAVHHCIRSFKCSFCDKTFAARKTMRVHEMGHRGERPFNCEHCDKTFRQPSDLKIHMEKHTADPNLLCPICYRAKSTIKELQEHLAQHKSNGYQCTKCGKTFKKLSHLKEHDRAVHLLLRPFKCDFCGLSFAARKTLRVHCLIHTDEFPATCSVCQKGFRASTNLQKHMRTIHKSDAVKGTTNTDSKDKITLK